MIRKGSAAPKSGAVFRTPNWVRRKRKKKENQTAARGPFCKPRHPRQQDVLRQCLPRRVGAAAQAPRPAESLHPLRGHSAPFWARRGSLARWLRCGLLEDAALHQARRRRQALVNIRFADPLVQAVGLQIPLCPPHLRRRRGGRQGCSCTPARSTLLMLGNEGVRVRNGVSVYIQRRFIQKRRGRCRARVCPLHQQARHRHGAAAPPLRFSSFLVLLLLKAAPLFFRFPLELAQRLRSGTVGGLHGGNALRSSFRPRAQRCPRGCLRALGLRYRQGACVHAYSKGRQWRKW